MLENKKISFIGGGAIAESIIKGLLSGGRVQPAQITVSDIAGSRLDYLQNHYGVRRADDSRQAAKMAEILFLTVKPQVIDEVLITIAPFITPDTMVISVAAGITLATLEDKLPGVPVVRVMPNTPVAVGEGMAAIALGTHADRTTEQVAAYIFQAVGKTVTVAENAMDAVTGLSGSGPAYAFLIIEALSDAGVRMGLTRQQSVLLSSQTLLGAAKMVLETGEHPAKLRDMVTSPGGTTIAGIHVMEQKAVRAAMMDAVIAAMEKSREMGRKR